MCHRRGVLVCSLQRLSFSYSIILSWSASLQERHGLLDNPHPSTQLLHTEIMDTDMTDDEFDLTPIFLDNAGLIASRSLTVAELPHVLPRPISKRRGKKRSSRACTTCRFRKVRCNVVAHGAPCSNCRHDEIECILPLSRRQRYVSQKQSWTKTWSLTFCLGQLVKELKLVYGSPWLAPKLEVPATRISEMNAKTQPT